MSFLTAVKLVLTSMPGLIRLVQELSAWLKSHFGDDPARAIEDHANAIRLLREAKTPDEKARAAKSLATLIRRL